MQMVQRAFVFCAVLLLAACATTTETQSTWQTKTGEPRPAFGHIFVIVLSESAVTSAAVEQQVKKSLAKRSVEATLASAELGGESQQAEQYRAHVEAAVKESGADGVMVVSLLKVEERDEYVPPQVDYMPMTSAPMYLGYGPYVGYSYSAVYQPGYYQNATDYYLQTQLYNVANKKPVWQAQSRSMNPYSLNAGAEGYAKSVVGQLDRDGALKR
ncbi:DUF4136 domain-containing protein [Alcanivorax sp. DP30]|uniref:DUF4136 domain-containing protein n=1 Tax=Alcanivorax sp. DP30 TaxID=2606217 RepID=UPI00136C4027|nr:DUF4136 domain-containing protein [Alcanivorax sp. DP30]MZR63189.1 hypothetical protein [Alcanivorax sp. DP30]